MDHESSIFGNSILVTFCCSIANFAAYGGCIIFSEVIMKLLMNLSKILTLESQAKTAVLYSTFLHRTKSLYFSCMIISLIPLMGLLIPRENCYIVGMTFLSAWEFFHVCLLIYFNPPISTVRKELHEFIEKSDNNPDNSESTKELKGKM